jgi:hypothetical protein
MTVLLWGLPDDPPMSAVKGALDVLHASYVFLDQRDVGETFVSLRVGETITGTLESGGVLLRLEDVTAFYLWPYDTRRLPSVAQAGENSRLWRQALRVDEIL